MISFVQRLLKRLEDGARDVALEGFQSFQGLRSPGIGKQFHERVAGDRAADLPDGADGRLAQLAFRIHERKDDVDAFLVGSEPVDDVRLRTGAQLGESADEHRRHRTHAIGLRRGGDGRIAEGPVIGLEKVQENLEALFRRGVLHDHVGRGAFLAGGAVLENGLGRLDGLFRREIPQRDQIIGHGVGLQPAEGSFPADAAERRGDGVLLDGILDGRSPGQQRRFGFPPPLVGDDVAEDRLRSGFVPNQIQDGVPAAEIGDRRDGGGTGQRVGNVLLEEIDVFRRCDHAQLREEELTVHGIRLRGDSLRKTFANGRPIFRIRRIGDGGRQGREGIFHEGVLPLLAQPGRKQFHGGGGGSGEVLHVLRKCGGVVARHDREHVAHDGRRNPTAGILTERQRGADQRQQKNGYELFHGARSWKPRAHAWAG